VQATGVLLEHKAGVFLVRQSIRLKSLVLTLKTGADSAGSTPRYACAVVCVAERVRERDSAGASR